MRADYSGAIKDINDGIRAYDIWGYFGWQEVKRRYRRTVLGPFWAVLSLGIFVMVLGFLWSEVWRQDIRVYLPYLSSGLVVWTLVQMIITEGCSSFTQYEAVLKNFSFPYSLLAAQIVWRNIIVFFHNLVIYVVTAILFEVDIGWTTLLAIPGLILIAINGVWIALLLGMVCARYRDVQQLVASILQIALFVTPILWSADQMGPARAAFIYPNLLYHMIDVVRAPLLGHAPAPSSYIIVAGFTAAGWGLTLWVFARLRRRVPFWI